MLRKVGKALERAIGAFTRLQTIVASIFFIFLLLVIAQGVFLRYVLRAPATYSFELSALCMLPVIALALAHAQQHKANVNVTMLVGRFPIRVRFGLEIINYIIFLAYTIVLAMAGGYLAYWHLERQMMSLDSGVPLFFFSILLLIGFVGVCLQLVIDIKNALGRAKANRSQT